MKCPPALRRLLPALALAALGACAQLSGDAAGPPRLALEAEGVLECSADPAQSCELSAAACLRHGAAEPTVVLASDRPLDGRHPWAVLTARPDGTALRPTGILPMDDEATKIEALTPLAGGRFLLAVPANDREGAAFQNLLLWDTQRLHVAPTVMPVLDAAGRPGSLRDALIGLYRQRFGPEVGFVKVEGAAGLGGDALLLGVRSYGASFRNARDVLHLVSARLAWRDGRPALDAGSLQLLADLSAPVDALFGKPFGVADLFYDAAAQQLWLLASHESAQGGAKTLEGRLLTARLAPGGDRAPEGLAAANGPQGTPLRFEGKPEGLCALAPGRFLVVFDDDRELTGAGRPSARTTLSRSRYEILVRDGAQPAAARP